MNLQRKAERQARRIELLEQQLQERDDEIQRLKEQIQDLRVRNAALEMKAGVAIAAKNEYTACMEEIAELKEQYRKAIYDAQGIKKEYAKKFNRLLDRVRAGK